MGVAPKRALPGRLGHVRAQTIGRPRAAVVSVVLLFSLSSVARFVASLWVRTPWIAPDEMLYGRSGREFWETGHLVLLGNTAPFVGFYPVLAGLPLALFGDGHGVIALKAFEALLASSTVVIVFLWARQIVSARWALAAGAITAALPALARSGLIMTEAVFLPAATAALWLAARALTRPTWQRQVLAGVAVTAAIAVRYQGVVLVPALVLAIIVMACFERDGSVFLRMWPLALSVGLGLVVLYAARAAVGGGSGAFGAYGAGVRSHYELVGVLRWTFREAGDVYLLVVGMPLVALCCLFAEQLRARTRDRGVCALLSVTLAYSVLVVVQVGVFASENLGHLSGRYLVTVAPPIFVSFAVWLARGMPRPKPEGLILAWAIAAPAILLPVGTLATSAAVPDSFMSVPLFDLANRTSPRAMADSWAIAAGVLALLAALLPRSLRAGSVALVFSCLAAATILVQPTLVHRTRFDREDFFGNASPQWIDQRANGPVTYLDDGDPLWNEVWQQAFWNESIVAAVTVKPDNSAPTFGVTSVSVAPDGRLLTHGVPLRDRLIVAPNPVTLRGRRLASITQGRDEPGLTLWRPDGSPSISTETVGVLAHNDDLVSPVTVTVFNCTTGALALTVYAKQGVPGLAQGTPALAVAVNKLQPTQVSVDPGNLWHISVPAPNAGIGYPQRCVFHVIAHGRVGLFHLAFKRGRWTPPSHPAFTINEHDSTTAVWGTRGRALPSVGEVEFCRKGEPLTMTTDQWRASIVPKHAVLAHYIAGKGLTCKAPPRGFVGQGYASRAQHLPYGIYVYYGPVEGGA